MDVRRTAIWVGVLWGLQAFGQADAGAPEPRVVDRVVAVVEGRAITLSQLEFEVRVALIQQGGLAAAEVPLDQAALRCGLDLAIAQRLASNEADRLQAFPVDEAEVVAAINAMREKLGAKAYQGFLARWDTDEPHLASVLARSIRADRFLSSKVRLRTQVSEAEVRKYYDDHPQGQRYEAIRVALREKLMREKYQQAVADEIAQARRTADVRLVAPFARKPAECKL
jgi:hypothetical protein